MSAKSSVILFLSNAERNNPMKFFKLDKKEPFQNTIVGILLLGIIGSALWEKVISPLSTFLFLKISNLLSVLFTDWNNSLYTKISNSYYDRASVSMFLFVYGLVFGVFFALSLKSTPLFKKLTVLLTLDKNDEDDTLPEIQKSSTSSTSVKKKQNIVANFCTYLTVLILFIFVAFNAGEISYTEYTKSAILSNLEIVSPYIEDNEYKTLKSNFHSMDCEDDFINLVQELSEIATEYNLELKEVQQPFS